MLHKHIHEHAHARTHTHTHTRTHAHTYTHARMHTHTHLLVPHPVLHVAQELQGINRDSAQNKHTTTVKPHSR